MATSAATGSFPASQDPSDDHPKNFCVEQADASKCGLLPESGRKNIFIKIDLNEYRDNIFLKRR
jgi:hypothetical protein